MQPDPRRWKALALLCGAFFMVILDTAIVLVALPSIQTDLGFSPSSGNNGFDAPVFALAYDPGTHSIFAGGEFRFRRRAFHERRHALAISREVIGGPGTRG